MSTRNSLRLYEAKEGGLELSSELVRKLASTKEMGGHIWFDKELLIAWSNTEIYIVASTNNELLQTLTLACGND